MVDELQLSASELRSSRYYVEVPKLYRSVSDGSEGNFPEQRSVDGVLDGVATESDSTGGVALGVSINEKRTLLRYSEARGDIDGGSGLPDPALLISDCNDASHFSSGV